VFEFPVSTSSSCINNEIFCLYCNESVCEQSAGENIWTLMGQVKEGRKIYIKRSHKLYSSSSNIKAIKSGQRDDQSM
jgi:hypothetical protein